MAYVTRTASGPASIVLGGDAYTGIVGCCRSATAGDVDHLGMNGWAQLADGDPISLVTAAAGSLNGDWNSWPGGQGWLTVCGTFGGATAKLQYLAPDASALDVSTVTNMTAPGGSPFALPPSQIRLSVSGGSSSSITATVAKVGR